MTINESSPNFDDQPLIAEPANVPRKQGKENWAEAKVAVGAWVISIFFIVFIPLSLIIPYIGYIWALHGPPTAATLAADKWILFLSILGVLPAHLETFALIWLIVTYAGRLPFDKAIGLEWPKSLGPVWGSALSVIVAIVLWGVAGVITYFFGDQKTDLDLLVESSIPARWMTAFVAFFTAPIVEESLYRGLLYPAFEKGFNSIVRPGRAMALAILSVSVLFAGVHVFQYRNNLAVISVIVLFSVSLTLIRALSGKLMPCFVIHLVFNGIQSFILIVTTGREAPTPPPAPSMSFFLDLIRFFS